MTFNSVDVSLFSLTGILFTLTVITYLRNRRNPINICFAFFTLITSLWPLAAVMFRLSENMADAFFWSKLIYVSGILAPAVFLLFAFTFKKRGEALSSFEKAMTLLPPLMLLFLLFFTNLWVEKIILNPRGNSLVLGPAYNLWMIIFLASMGASFATFVSRYYSVRGHEKAQLRFISFAYSFPFLLTIPFNIVAPLLGDYRLIWIAPFGLTMMSLLITYALVKRRLIDIRLIVARIVAYFLLMTIISVFYIFGLLLAGYYFYPATLTANQLKISIILILITAFTFQSLRGWLVRTISRIFFKERYDSHELLGDLSKIKSSTINLKVLTKRTLTRLIKTMGLTSGAFILIKDRQIYHLETLNLPQSWKMKNKDLFVLMSKNKPLIFEELFEEKLKKILRKYGLTFSILLRSKRENVGLLCLGEKASGDNYTDQDIKVLEILAPELAVAIQNAQAYEKIRKFNITLREQIKAATKELRLTNQELRRVSALKDEFVSIASHELRTPLSAIGGSISTILEGYAGEISNQAKEFLMDTYEENERLIRLVNNLLNISRIESGQMVFKIKTINLPEIIREVIETFQLQAKKKSIKLFYEKPKKKLPKIKADPDKVREILVNLIGNALKFTRKGSVKINHEIKDKIVVTAVVDTGSGIKKEDQKMLFQKFSKLNARGTEKKGGTGLGLYICKNLIEQMNGRIWLESEIGQGSTFFFSLPRAS